MLPKGAEWIVILIVALLLFGPKNLPKLGSALGKTVKNVRDGMEGVGEDEKSEDADAATDEDAECMSSSMRCARRSASGFRLRVTLATSPRTPSTMMPAGNRTRMSDASPSFATRWQT